MSRAGADKDFDFLSSALENNLEPELAEVLMLLGGLKQLTLWEDPVLREELGCHPERRPRSTPRSKAEIDAAMAHSSDYLTWVHELVSLVDLTADARHVVSSAFELCAGAGGMPSERVEHCRAAFAVPGRDGFPATDYLALGEITQAFHAAALALEKDCPARQRAERVERLTQPLADLRTHIHPDRLRAFNSPDRVDTLGRNVSSAIAEHLSECTTCSSLVDSTTDDLSQVRSAA
jgi:hypothetical protein